MNDNSALNLGVVVPTKNRPRELKKCLRSLGRSAEKAKEKIIVVVINDDTQNLQPVELEQSNHEWMTVIYTENPGPAGAAGARIHGVEALQTRIIGFIDDDATVNIDWVSCVSSACRPGVAITGRVLSAVGQTSVFAKARQVRYDDRARKALKVPSVDYMAGGNSAVTRSDYEAAGGFDAEMTMMHDRDLALRLKRVGVEILYTEDIEILHEHFKTLSTYLAMTVQSGRYRRQLEKRWPAVGPWTVSGALKSVQKTRADLLVRAVITVSEMLHGFGYITTKMREKKGSN